jgi:hypothetical protein
MIVDRHGVHVACDAAGRYTCRLKVGKVEGQTPGCNLPGRDASSPELISEQASTSVWNIGALDFEFV